MNQDRFSEIKELLARVAELPEEERDAYLDRACKDDPELRKEIDSILSHTNNQPGILKTGGAIRNLHETHNTSRGTDHRVGQTIGRYKILERIGCGGMGTVYKAEDTSLRRTVALKFLPLQYHFDDASKARFMIEAQTAAALDHPNICTVFEISESVGQTFIAMAFCDGETVKEKIAQRPLRIKDVLEIGIQVGEGLKKAHEKNIIHRDIKPANLMVTDNGLVRIMDFGIARSSERAKLTKTGTTLGTIAYMSPEQSRGEEIDSRTDIWSLGVTLYEMITGRLPFERERDQATIFAIQNEDPPPVTSLRSDVMIELEQIVNKCIQKNPDYRYQTAGDLVADLRFLEDRIRTSTVQLRPTVGMDSISRKKWPLWLWISLFSVLAAAAVVFLTGHLPFLHGSFKVKNSIQVTSTSAWQTQPAISPDGGRIAFTSNESGNLDIYLTDVHGGQTIQITTDSTDDYDPAWFPDGSAIIFTSERTGSPAIWKTGQLGGIPIHLLPNAQHPSISPDGEWLAFTRNNEEGELRVGISPLADLSSVRIITDDGDGTWHHRYPSWSPDGRLIAYSAQENIWVVSTEDGRSKPLTNDGNYHRQTVWSPDGRYVYFASEREGSMALWSISRDGGEPGRLTMGTGSESHPSISSDGKRLAYTTEFVNHDIILKNIRTDQEWRLKGPRYESMPSIAPDKSGIVFISDRLDRRSEIWYLPLPFDEENPELRRITDHPGQSSHPVFSPDGNWIAYYRILDVLGEQRDIWTVPISGGPSHRLTTSDATDIHPSWSPDGRRIAFISDRSGQNHIWLMEVQNGRGVGEPSELTHGEVFAIAPVWSPDGSHIAFIGLEGDEAEVWSIAVDSQSPPERITSGAQPIRVRWNQNGATLLVSGMWGGNDISLREVNLELGETFIPEYDVDFGWRSAEGCFDISSDGELIAYTRKETSGDIWMLEAE